MLFLDTFFCYLENQPKSDRLLGKVLKIVNHISDPMNAPRYCGIPAFMRTAHITDLRELDIALLGIPYDGAVEEGLLDPSRTIQIGIRGAANSE